MLDMSDILYDGISYLAEDGNYLDYLGIKFYDPENAVDDQSGFKVIVPEETPEVTITFSSEAQEQEEPIVTPVDDEEDEEETDTVVPGDDVVIPPDDEDTEPEVITKIICEDGTEVTSKADCPIIEIPPEDDEDEIDSLFNKIFQLAMKILAAFGFGAGFLALVNHYWKGGQKNRALKMLNTAIKKALLGKYDKYKK